MGRGIIHAVSPLLLEVKLIPTPRRNLFSDDLLGLLSELVAKSLLSSENPDGGAGSDSKE